jgi:hypothetical protein
MAMGRDPWIEQVRIFEKAVSDPSPFPLCRNPLLLSSPPLFVFPLSPLVCVHKSRDILWDQFNLQFVEVCAVRSLLHLCNDNIQRSGRLLLHYLFCGKRRLHQPSVVR